MSDKPEPRAKRQCQGRPNTVSAAWLTPSVPDISTFHQSCDVTRGTKWAANMWFYNHAP